MKVESIFYKKLEDNKVQCTLCTRECIITDNNKGFCKTQENIKGKLFNLNFNVLSSFNIDPIEKKPLYHFLPGSNTLSIGGFSCNMKCLNCQNHSISQVSFDSNRISLTPSRIVDFALDNNCPSISWTYNEPTLHTQFAFEVFKLSKEYDLKNVFVSNAYMSSNVLDELLKYVDAFNIDLKFINDELYKKVTGANLKPVISNIKKIYNSNSHLELTNLLITDYNTSTEDISSLVSFIVNDLDVSVPLHFSRFFPYYKLDTLSSTPVESLYDARSIALDSGLEYVYLGNIGGVQSSYCPNCGELLIKRNGYGVSSSLDSNKCFNCSSHLNFVF